ncbi:hypothetical protein BHE74_00026099 [Ensete ventricosum]|nr:hypothetical protein GW17_00021951 [Ensete ventricosum]RWW66526.1 hypothetical protein BHE74_00026099 [Ensete ventricosum]RZR93476.1 hypothetical protein BHM03_00021989 [Ensete ventricosum]
MRRRRSLFLSRLVSPHGEQEARQRRIARERQIAQATNCEGDWGRSGISLFSPFSSSPSSSFSLNRPPTVEIDRRRPISVVPPGSGHSAYWYPVRPVHTARTERYRTKRRTLFGVSSSLDLPYLLVPVAPPST